VESDLTNRRHLPPMRLLCAKSRRVDGRSGSGSGYHEVRRARAGQKGPTPHRFPAHHPAQLSAVSRVAAPKASREETSSVGRSPLEMQDRFPRYSVCRSFVPDPPSHRLAALLLCAKSRSTRRRVISPLLRNCRRGEAGPNEQPTFRRTECLHRSLWMPEVVSAHRQPCLGITPDARPGTEEDVIQRTRHVLRRSWRSCVQPAAALTALGHAG
jgi:hypothetical protein